MTLESWSRLEGIEDEETLEAVLAQPSPALVSFVNELAGDIAILGVGGKMGLTLAARLQRAIQMAGTSKTV